MRDPCPLEAAGGSRTPHTRRTRTRFRLFNIEIMAKISQETIDKLMEAAKIEDVIEDSLGKYDRHNTTGLKKKGVRYQALCPWHDDKHLGSFVIYPKGNCYKCFVCGAKGGVIDWLMDYEKLSYPDALRYLGKKYSIDVDDVPIDYTPPPPRPAPPPLPTLVLPRKMIADRMRNDHDTLCTWIRHLPWAPEQRARVEEMLRLYCVGHTTVHQEWSHQEHHFTVFWQVDSQGNPRTGHLMKYKPDGHRIKDKDVYNTDWFHSMLSRHWDAEARETTYDPPYPYPSIYNPDKQEARLCLFGEHLLNRYPQAPVCIVESEKTAVLMAIAYGNHPMQVWMACCGSSNITRDRLEPLIAQRRRIILYPDRDGIEAWTKRARELNYDRVTIDTRAVTKWWRPEDGPKADIADVVLRIICEASKAKAPTDATTQKLIDNLQLEPIKQ